MMPLGVTPQPLSLHLFQMWMGPPCPRPCFCFPLAGVGPPSWHLTTLSPHPTAVLQAEYLGQKVAVKNIRCDVTAQAFLAETAAMT